MMLCGIYITVCESVLTKFEEFIKGEDRSDKAALEKKLMKFCKDLKGKDERFVSTQVHINLIPKLHVS